MNNRRINIPAGSCSALVENENIVKREELKHALLNKESNSYGDVEIFLGKRLGNRIPMGRITPSSSQSDILERFENSVYKVRSYLYQNIFCSHKTMKIEHGDNQVSVLEKMGEDDIEVELRNKRNRSSLRWHPPFGQYYIIKKVPEINVNGSFKLYFPLVSITPSYDQCLVLGEFEGAVDALRTSLYQSLFCENNIVSLQCADSVIQILVTNK